MPVEQCQINDGPGRRWGKQGTCYPYTAGDEASLARANQKARNQGIASGEIDISKNAEDVDVCATAPIIKRDDRQRLITAVVLEPWDGDPTTADEMADLDDDVITVEEITAAMRGFMRDYGRKSRLGYMHEDGEPPLELVESWQTRFDMELGGQHVRAGTWLMTQYVACDTMWAAVESGELDGLSIGSTGSRRSV